MTTMTAAQVRAHTAPMEQAPDPEVPERPRPPRTYPAAYKLRILAEYEQLDKAGKGALLRREGLYTSLISEWRKQRDRGRWPRWARACAAAARRPTRCSGRLPGCAAVSNSWRLSWARPAG
jgi:transposase